MYPRPQPSAALCYISLRAKHMHRLLPCKSGRVSGARKHLALVGRDSQQRKGSGERYKNGAQGGGWVPEGSKLSGRYRR